MMFFSKKPSVWVPFSHMSHDSSKLFDSYLITNELFLNNLSVRIRQSGGWFSNQQKWTLLAIVSEINHKLEGLFACNNQGFASIHITCKGSKLAEYSKELADSKLFQSSPIRMLMGETESVKSIVPYIKRPVEIIMDYEMLVRRKTTPLPTLSYTEGFKCIQSSSNDFTKLLPLQIAYEKEEVVLPGHSIQHLQSKRYLKDSLIKQICVHGVYQNQIITKGMTNVRGITIDQIGGVFTIPELRNRGLGKQTMVELLRLIHQQEKDASLFVKNYNIPAISLYTSIGFSKAGRFSIGYFL
jgi:GNAT superfamily N-acetyltransferase